MAGPLGKDWRTKGVVDQTKTQSRKILAPPQPIVEKGPTGFVKKKKKHKPRWRQLGPALTLFTGFDEEDFHPTLHFRFLKDADEMGGTLQQAWKHIKEDRYVWKDVPVVIAGTQDQVLPPPKGRTLADIEKAEKEAKEKKNPEPQENQANDTDLPQRSNDT